MPARARRGPITTRTLRAGVVTALLLVVVAACSSGGSDGTASTVTRPTALPLVGTHWVLSGDTDLGVPTTGVVVTALFKAGALSGNSGCNGYRTTYKVNGSKMTISAQIAGTLVGCPPAPTAVEQEYRTRLPQVTSYVIKGRTLTLQDGTDTALLVYDATDGASAITGKWTATSYYTGTAIQSAEIGSTLTADFKGGQVSGESGCNSFGGPYEVSGSTIKLGPFRSTLKACTDPVLATQEQKYVAALELATTYQVTGARLELFRADGGIAATFDR
jgi:heat shock protein HslJ